jgi:hypothetical protein
MAGEAELDRLARFVRDRVDWLSPAQVDDFLALSGPAACP